LVFYFNKKQLNIFKTVSVVISRARPLLNLWNLIRIVWWKTTRFQRFLLVPHPMMVFSSASIHFLSPFNCFSYIQYITVCTMCQHLFAIKLNYFYTKNPPSLNRLGVIFIYSIYFRNSGIHIRSSARF
jgi:hypothetical protein